MGINHCSIIERYPAASPTNLEDRNHILWKMILRLALCKQDWTWSLVPWRPERLRFCRYIARSKRFKKRHLERCKVGGQDLMFFRLWDDSTNDIGNDAKTAVKILCSTDFETPRRIGGLILDTYNGKLVVGVARFSRRPNVSLYDINGLIEWTN